jgi:hypothetical protein
MPGTNTDWKTFKALIATPDLPGLGPEQPTSRRTAAEVNRLVDRFIAGATLPGTMQASLRSAALLWHDHLDASHEISQEIHTPEGSFLHGIMHRREPDYGNAKYWFQRVGSHPAFPKIADHVTRLLEVNMEKDLSARLAPRGKWDPLAFVDECEQAAHQPGGPIKTLQAIQEIEFDCLLAHLFIEPDTRPGDPA